MKCVETKRRRNGTTWRRYVTEDGRAVTTMELPMSVLRIVSKRRLADQIAAWQRGEEQRKRIHRMRSLISQGVKPLAIAHELGVSEVAVRVQRRRMEAARAA